MRDMNIAITRPTYSIPRRKTYGRKMNRIIRVAHPACETHVPLSYNSRIGYSKLTLKSTQTLVYKSKFLATEVMGKITPYR